MKNNSIFVPSLSDNYEVSLMVRSA